MKTPKKLHTSAAPVVGIVEWLRPGEYEHVEAVVADLKKLDVKELRMAVSWADWHAEGGMKWYDWLMPRLAKEVNLLPCLNYTPPSLGIVPKVSSPPRDPKAYADFLDVIITRYGNCFDYVELWNEPNNLIEWDYYLDPGWKIFCEMVGAAAYWAKQRGKKTVLGGMSSADYQWLDVICRAGVTRYIDVVGVHGFPKTWESAWAGWTQSIQQIQEVLDRHGIGAEIWITEAGYSTWRHDGFRQLKEFVKFLDAPVPRAYWYAGYDLHPECAHQEGFHQDERHYHFGLKQCQGTEKLLYRIWSAEGIEGVRAFDRMYSSNGEGRKADLVLPRMRLPRDGGNNSKSDVLITGGAGFIGTNLAHRLLSQGRTVLLLDNLSRSGVEKNVKWLRELHGHSVRLQIADIRDPFVVKDAVRSVEGIFHFAAQVAVTSALIDPATDFEVNARGTLNLLEALRTLRNPPPLLFTSTNKVYGEMKSVRLCEAPTRYRPAESIIHSHGFDESFPLDFYSPYGCSKGTADQYVIDYARTFNLPAVVFRMSCIYGTRQFGTEDQGWVAHFLIRSLQGEPIILYGDGKQVRDILFVEDLIDALLLAHKHIDIVCGRAFNIGGGTNNTTSLREILDLIAELRGERPEIKFGPWRKGDQRYYVSDTRAFNAATGWTPKTSVREGVEILHRWLLENESLFRVESPAREIAS
ncbi:MAG: NAD-dependent epimerase/dehydratase family protein [Candidatus Abyssobacteria bacterium SURF_5]|uniref:NAD-dependent epimerase/dehydratase family protein n=1 Tax=Abyssobacteria bacterium (strain SURF_5) TaxID=2093360 RepID=A0A3A4MVV4_ABYX5|nr:MAG: NAD-dependent epimerase/dehydratase family protein [Candidatus Abyssubacteria bacterium SURF_5]